MKQRFGYHNATTKGSRSLRQEHLSIDKHDSSNRFGQPPQSYTDKQAARQNRFGFRPQTPLTVKQIDSTTCDINRNNHYTPVTIDGCSETCQAELNSNINAQTAQNTKTCLAVKTSARQNLVCPSQYKRDITLTASSVQQDCYDIVKQNTGYRNNISITSGGRSYTDTLNANGNIVNTTKSLDTQDSIINSIEQMTTCREMSRAGRYQSRQDDKRIQSKISTVVDKKRTNTGVVEAGEVTVVSQKSHTQSIPIRTTSRSRSTSRNSFKQNGVQTGLPVKSGVEERCVSVTRTSAGCTATASSAVSMATSKEQTSSMYSGKIRVAVGSRQPRSRLQKPASSCARRDVGNTCKEIGSTASSYKQTVSAQKSRTSSPSVKPKTNSDISQVRESVAPAESVDAADDNLEQTLVCDERQSLQADNHQQGSANISHNNNDCCCLTKSLLLQDNLVIDSLTRRQLEVELSEVKNMLNKLKTYLLPEVFSTDITNQPTAPVVDGVSCCCDAVHCSRSAASKEQVIRLQEEIKELKQLIENQNITIGSLRQQLSNKSSH